MQGKTINPNRPAQEMTCAEMMACYVAMSSMDEAKINDEWFAKQVVAKVLAIYKELNKNIVI